jgi:hypothetical protein
MRISATLRCYGCQGITKLNKRNGKQINVIVTQLFGKGAGQRADTDRQKTFIHGYHPCDYSMTRLRSREHRNTFNQI